MNTFSRSWTHSAQWFRGGMAVAVVCMSVTAATAQTATARIVKAADTFLSTLDAQQKKNVGFAFDDEKQRALWSNFPKGIVQRKGLSMGELTPAQRTAAMELVGAALSKRGLEKVEQIVAADEVLKTQEGSNGPGGGRGPRGGNGGPPPGGFPGGPPGGGPPGGGGPGGPGGGLIFGKDLYYISILGTPSQKTPWMIQFGGHHLALNITIDGDKGILTPTLTGAQPATYTVGDKTVRPLGAESDKGLALLNSLDDAEKKKAIIGARLADLVLGPGQDGVIIQPEGLKGSAMTEKQRAMMLDVIGEWAGIVHESAATARMAQLKAELNDTWFAWSGPTDGTIGKNISSYYRIQGPHLVIEYSPQGLGGDASNHIHTMYRDPTNDYGRAPVKK